MGYCTKCGGEIDDTQRFCPKCGAENLLYSTGTEEDLNKATDNQNQNANNQNPNSNYNQNANNQNPNSNYNQNVNNQSQNGSYNQNVNNQNPNSSYNQNASNQNPNGNYNQNMNNQNPNNNNNSQNSSKIVLIVCVTGIIILFVVVAFITISGNMAFNKMSSDEVETTKNIDVDITDKSKDETPTATPTPEPTPEPTKEAEETKEPKPDKSDDDYILPNSSNIFITTLDLKDLTDEELELAKNEIYAREGYIFEDASLDNYFNQKDWYEGTILSSDFTEDNLNKIEKHNIEVIEKAQSNRN